MQHLADHGRRRETREARQVDGGLGVSASLEHTTGTRAQREHVARSHEVLGPRVALAYMPEAPIPAARQALERAGLNIGKMDAIKTHNPFAVNDILFAREMKVDGRRINNFGSTLVWGHPNAPMGTRGIIELIEELAKRGGGYGLFTGCAAGDSSMAIVLQVGGG